MKNLSCLLCLIGILIFTSGCASNKLTLRNETYRTGNASEAQLASIGYVTGAGFFGGTNRFEKKRLPNYKNIKIQDLGTVSVTEIKGLEAEIETKVNAKISEQADAKAKLEGKLATSEDLKAKYHIISLESPDEAVVELNDNQNTRSLEILKLGKENSRIISKILVAYDYQQSSALTSSGSISLEAKAKDGISVSGTNITDANATVEGKLVTNNKSEIKLSDGMIVGYRYDILCWHKKNDGTVELLTSVEDKYGSPQKCHTGEPDPNKL